MTIAAVGTPTTTAAAGAVTGVTVAEPAGTTATTISILTVETKRATAATAVTISTPTGWTLIGAVSEDGSAVAPANDVGTNGLAMFYRVGTGYGATTITTTNVNSMGAGIAVYSTSTGGTWDVAQTSTGSDTASGANGSITFGANISLAAGDWAIVGASLSGDLGSVTAETLAATGATIGTRANRINLGVTTGTDSRLLVSDWPVTAGTQTAWPTPSYTWTNTSSLTGHARVVRLREVAPAAPTGTPTVTPGTTTHRTAPLSWTAVSGATGYEVERGGTIVATLGNVTSWTDTTLVESTVYAYRVRGFNSGGSGPYSSSVNATTTAAPAWTATNLFPNPRPAAGATGWGNFTGTASVITAAAGPAGANALQVAWSTPNGGIGGGVSFGQTGARVPGVAGTEYRAAIYAKVNRAQRIGVAYEYFGADGTTQVGFTATTDHDLPANTWTHLTHVATAPASTAFVVVTVYSTAGGSGSLWTTGDVLQVQAATVVATSTTVEAFHGDMTDTANRVYDWTGTADASTSTVGAGATIPTGSGTGSWSFTGAAVGKRTPKASGSGSWSFTSTAAGKRTPKASGSGTFTFAGTATGSKPTKGSGNGAWSFAGAAVGQTPVVGAKTGSGSGSWTFAGTATGSRAPKASGSGTFTFAGAGSGKRVAKATGTGAWSFAGAGSGKRVAGAAGSGSWTFAGAGSGKRTPKAVGSGSWTFSGSATGTAPIVGQKSGTGAGTWTFAGAAVGKRSPKASGSGTFAYVGTASGTRPTVAPKTGSGSGTWTFAGTAAGKRTPKATATGLFTWVGTAAAATTHRGAGAGAWAYAGAAAGSTPALNRPVAFDVTAVTSPSLGATAVGSPKAGVSASSPSLGITVISPTILLTL